MKDKMGVFPSFSQIRNLCMSTIDPPRCYIESREHRPVIRGITSRIVRENRALTVPGMTG